MTDLEKRVLALESLIQREIKNGDDVLIQVMGRLKDFQENLDRLESRLQQKINL